MFMLYPDQPALWQFVSYAFLHGGPMHIIGNMYFLYIFGRNVNARLGNLSYICLYLGGAIFSGIGHSLLSSHPVLGASGAIAAVTGIYLALFPQSLITVLFWFFYFIRTFEFSALYFIVFKLIFWDNVLEPQFAPAGISYGAHLAGYAFGIAAMLILLSTGLLKSSQFDLWAMIKRFYRRRQYRNSVAAGYNPFAGQNTAGPVKAKEVKTPAQREKEEKIMNLRALIAQRVSQVNLPAAVESYTQLMQLDPDQVLPRQHLLDIANQLTASARHAEAAQAYETFLNRYGNYEYIEQVQLMLGILYARYLNQPGQAAENLRRAREKLSDPGQIKMCDDELAKLEN